MLLTENYGHFDVLRYTIPAIETAVVIFGSSFRNDQQYTQVLKLILVLHMPRY